MKLLDGLAAIAALSLLAAGCATKSVNPAQARANTGYVDFHAASSDELSWSVARFDEQRQDFQTVFSELDPPQDGVLRLAFKPGRYQFQITFLNRVITKPAELEVAVEDGRVTQVRVTLADAGTTQVRTKEVSRGGTGYGYGRRTRIGSDETTMHSLSAEAGTSVPYQPKEQMPYAR